MLFLSFGGIFPDIFITFYAYKFIRRRSSISRRIRIRRFLHTQFIAMPFLIHEFIDMPEADADPDILPLLFDPHTFHGAIPPSMS